MIPQEAGGASTDSLVLAHLGLIKKTARTLLVGTGMEESLYEDAVMAGIEGFLAALQRYDGTKGAKLSTYSTYYVTASIRALLLGSISSGTLPERTAKELAAYRKAVREYAQMHGGESPGEAFLMEKLHLGKKKLQELAALDLSVGSALEIPDGGEWADAPADPAPGPEEQMEALDLRERLSLVLKGLPEPERDVLRLRFGLSGEPHTVSGTAEALSIPEEDVLFYEASALLSLRGRKDIQELHVFLEG
jgi:RNA polymerase sigma factor (sigma-70 family)